MLRPEGRLPRISVTPMPTDGEATWRGGYKWPYVLPGALVGLMVASAPPAASLYTAAIVVALVLIVFIRDGALLLATSLVKRSLTRQAASVNNGCATGSGPVSAAVRILMLGWPTVFPRAVMGRGAVTVITRVAGRPGMVQVQSGGLSTGHFGIMSLAACDGTCLPSEIQDRVRISVLLAACLGVDLRLGWPSGRGMPDVAAAPEFLADSFFPGRAADVTDAVLHRQVLELVAREESRLLRGCDVNSSILSGERYREQDPVPTPLTFSLLAARSARRGPAHMAGLMFGFSRYHARSVRLGAGIYDVIPEIPVPPRPSRLRNLTAMQYVRALDGVFSDFVVPGAISAAEGVAHGRRGMPAVLSSLDMLCGRLSFFQEGVAIAHAMMMENCLHAGGDSAFGLFGGDRRSVRPDARGDSGAWELMPGGARSRDDMPRLNLDLVKVLEPAVIPSGAGGERDMALWRRVEYFRAAFREVMGWTCAVTGRGLVAAGAAIGRGDLVFFASIAELRRWRRRYGVPPAGILAGRRDCIERVRSVSLPAFVTVACVESLEAGIAGASAGRAAAGVESLQGFLVSGRLPADGVVRIVHAGVRPYPTGANTVAVIGESDPSLVAELLDCAAVVAEQGGRLSHAAMLARESGLTFVSGVSGALTRLKDGDSIIIEPDCSIRVTASAGSADSPPPTAIDLVHLASAGRESGNKAAALAVMLNAGLKVPPGFVIRHEVLAAAGLPGREMTMSEAAGLWERIASLDMGHGFIARSSAAVEDGSVSSFAGAFRSVAGISGPRELAAAVRECLKSRDGVHADILRNRTGIRDNFAFSVILQPVVPAVYSGVAASRLAGAGDGHGDDVVIEVQSGTGGVVGGTGSPAAFLFRRIDRSVTPLSDAAIQAGFDQSLVGAVADCAIRVEELFGCPQDIEWCISGQEVWIVQSRPIVARQALPN